MKVLVATDGHGLLPFAWRLKREGVDVETIVFKDRFEEAWEGIGLSKVVRGKDKGKRGLEAISEAVKQNGVVVLTDSQRGLRTFAGHGQLFPKLKSVGEGKGVVALGAWFTGVEFTLPHLVVSDWGLWPGGAGPEVLGGITLVNVRSPMHSQLEELREQLVGLNFRGLVSAQLVAEGDKMLVGEVQLGWPNLHSEAFLSDLVSMRELLAEGEAELVKKYVVVVPVTVPPYPINEQGRTSSRTVNGIEKDDSGTIFFHDFKTNGDRELLTAGLDGYFCVVRGSGDCLSLARHRALSVAGKISVREKQVRLDVGAGVDMVLGMMVESGLVSDNN